MTKTYGSINLRPLGLFKGIAIRSISIVAPWQDEGTIELRVSKLVGMSGVLRMSS